MADYNIEKESGIQSFNEQLKVALKGVDKLIASFNTLNDATREGKSTIDAQNKANTTKKTVLTEVEKLEKQKITTEQKLKSLESQAALEVTKNKAAIQQKNKELKQEVQLGKAASDSLTAQRIKLAKMKQEYANVSMVQQKQLLPALKKQNELVKAQEKAYGDNQRDVANYAGQLDGLTNNMGGTVSGFKMMIMQAKAFIATPIGLVLAAVAGAVALISKAFKSSQPLMDAFSRTSKAIGAALAVVTDRIATFFENLKSGETTLSSVGKSIMDNVINRFRAVAIFGEAIGLVLKGKFKEGAEAAKTATIQLATGLDEIQQSKAADTLKGITDEIKEESTAASELEGARQKLRDEENASLVTLAELNQELQKNRLLAKDQTKSDEERLGYLKKAQQAEIASTDIRVRLAEERARIMQEEVALGKSTADEIREAEEASAAAIEARTDSYKTQQRILSELSGFEKTIAADRAKIHEAQMAQIDSEYEAEFNLELAKDTAFEKDIERNETELENAEEQAEELLDIEKKKTEEKLRLLDIEKAAKEQLSAEEIAIANDLFAFNTSLGNRQIANLEQQTDEEGNITEEAAKKIAEIKRKQAISDKLQSLFNIAINTQVAASKVTAEAALAAPLLLPAIYAGGIAQAAVVIAQPIPEFKEGVRNFGGGLAIVGDGGESEAVVQSSGVWMSPSVPTLVNLEKGASVLNQKQIKNEGFDTSKGDMYLKQLVNKRDNGLTQRQLEKTMVKMSRREAINLKLQGK